MCFLLGFGMPKFVDDPTDANHPMHSEITRASDPRQKQITRQQKTLKFFWDWDFTT